MMVWQPQKKTQEVLSCKMAEKAYHTVNGGESIIVFAPKYRRQIFPGSF